MIYHNLAMEQSRKRRQRLAVLRQELAKLEGTQTLVENRGVELERALREKEVSQVMYSDYRCSTVDKHV